VLKDLLFLPIFKEVLGMELLHDSSGLVGSLNCQLKRLENKIDTSRTVALMKDLHRLDETIKKLEERTRNKLTEITSQIKGTEAMVDGKHKGLISKINDISSRIDNLEKKIDLAVRELKSEARKTSFLRKLLWLD
jgi:predicted  nucleic acid-binding Zn-ribbon protein